MKALVLSEIFLGGKSLATELAFVGLFACVNSSVLRQIAFRRKRLVAHVAAERSFASVCALVIVE